MRSSATIGDAAALEITLLGPGAGIRRRAAGRRRRRGVRGVARRPADAVQRAVHRLGRIAPALRRAAAAARAPTSRCRAASPCRPARQPIDASGRARWAEWTAARSSLATGFRSAIRPRPGMRARAADARLRRAAGRITRRFACCPARRSITSRRCARGAPVGAVRDRATIPIAWDSGSKAPRLTHARGADIISDATPLGVLQVPGVRAADPADGRSPDDRRLSEDRDGDRRRHRRRRAARLRPTRFRSWCARRAKRMAALIAQERALMAVEARRAVTDFVDALRRRHSARTACGRTSPLAPLTTFRVGGPADWLIETTQQRRDRHGAAARARRRACR